MTPSSHRVAKIHEIFCDLTDPRSPKNKQHLLVEIMMISICAVIGGADGWEDIETFARAKLDWLHTFLRLPYGIPSHDTFRRVLSKLDPEELQKCFRRWVRLVFRFTKKEVIAVDGKTLRRSYEQASDQKKAALHMISAWASENELVLGQMKTQEKSNEITAIPDLLKLLVLKGCVVTIDAMGCQKDIAKQIINQGGDYTLAVKGNQGSLHDAMKNLFDRAKALEFNAMLYDTHESVDAGHGRIEIRRCTVLPIMYLQQSFKLKWPGAKALVLIENQREISGKRACDTRYYISSLEMDAQQILSVVRRHWGVENRLHWVLDVVFREDDSRIRAGYGAENFSTLRRLAISLIKQEKTDEYSLKKKRYLAALNVQYLEKILVASALDF